MCFKTLDSVKDLSVDSNKILKKYNKKIYIGD